MKLKLLLLVLGLQTAWILASTFTQERALATGTLISLECVPVDPRDMLRGDYVTLSYKISSVPTQLFLPRPSAQIPPGKRVYVLLEKRGDFFEVTKASEKPLSASPAEVVLAGRSEYSSNTNTVRVLYGLERFYVREGFGNIRGKITVQAVVPASGHARLKQLFIDGRNWDGRDGG